MKKFLFLLPLIALLSCNTGENISPADNFVKFYGGGATYELLDMSFRADGEDGVVLLALRTGDVIEVVGEETNLLFSNKSDLYIIVTDGAGNPVLQKRIPIVSDVFGNLQDLEEAIGPARLTAVEGGGYYVICSTNTTFIDELTGDPIGEEFSIAVWAEFDNSFDLTGVTPTSWSAIGDTVNNYYGTDISPTNDGGVVIAGYTDFHGTNDFFYDKIGGTVDWPLRQPARSGSDDRVVRMFPTGDGKFAIFGRTDVASEDGEGGANVERRIITSDGIIENSLIYGITYNDDNGTNFQSNLWDIPYDVIEVPGGFVVVGASFGDASLSDGGIPFFMKVDLTGANTIEEDYLYELNPNGTANITGRAIGVTQTKTNDYIIVGEIDGLEEEGKEIMVLKTDQEGNQIGEEIRYGLLNGDELARRTLTAQDGSIYVGATYDFGGGLSQIGLLKLNSDGEVRR